MKILKAFSILPFLLLVISLSFTNSFAQNVLTKRPGININANCQGFLEILPDGYTTAQKYPVIIFFMGINSDGPGTSVSLETLITGTSTSLGNGYIQDQVRFGSFPTSFTVNGNTHKFIVIVPQFVINYNTRAPYPSEVNDVINYTVANYSVDTTRIYLTGNSSGGGPVWDYPAESSVYANRIASIVPFCSVVFPSKEKADILRNADVAVWAFHNEFDAGVPVAFTRDFVKLINQPTIASPEVKETIFPVAGHDCWYQAYNRNYTENTLDIYEWMLQFQRTVTKANAGVDQNLLQPTASAQLSGSGTGPNGTTNGFNWIQMSGPSIASFSNATLINPVVSNLIKGDYIFRLTITDNVGGTSTDDVAINVYPPRIEAENFIASSGNLGVAATTDEGGGSTVTFDVGKWADYNITVPASGEYILRFRVGAWFQNPQFVVKNSAGNVLQTVNVYWTKDWENYITMARTITQPAGTNQTIRIEGTAQQFNLNWLQVLDVPPATGPLPVKYSLFNANCINNVVNLTWKTETEIYTANFSVEKTTDNRTWTSIASIAATGQNGTEQTYNFRDNNSGNNSMYRIVANDFDGRKTYSSILKSNCGATDIFTLFPNPVNDIALASITVSEAAIIYLSVIDNKGAVVLQQKASVLTGVNQLSINVGSLPKGTYILQAQWNGKSKTTKIIKQ